MRYDKESIRQLSMTLRSEEDARAKRRFHSDAYHRHFEGYSEFYETDEAGKIRLRRVYTDDYYVCGLPRGKRIARKIALLLIWLATGAVFVWCATRPDAGNTLAYVVVPEIACIVCQVWMLLGLASLLTAPGKMTVGEWRASAERITRSGAAAAAAFAVTAIATVAGLCVTGGGAAYWLCAGGFLLCAGLAVAENRLMAATPYCRVPSGGEAPKGATHIR